MPPGEGPLAVRMRPATLDELVGQEHLLGPGSALRTAIELGRRAASAAATERRPRSRLRVVVSAAFSSATIWASSASARASSSGVSVAGAGVGAEATVGLVGAVPAGFALPGARCRRAR